MKKHQQGVRDAVYKTDRPDIWQSYVGMGMYGNSNNFLSLAKNLKEVGYSAMQAMNDVAESMIEGIGEKAVQDFYQRPEIKARVEEIHNKVMSDAQKISSEEEAKSYYDQTFNEEVGKQIQPEAFEYATEYTGKTYNRYMLMANDEYLKKAASKSSGEYIFNQGIKGSTAGSLVSLYVGEQVEDVYPANWVEKGASGALGILLDAPLFGLTGAPGKMAAKAALRSVSTGIEKKLIAEGISKEVAVMMAESAMKVGAKNILTKPLIQKGLVASATSASTLGGYDALRDIITQAGEISNNPELSLKDFDVLETLGAAGKGTLLGAGLGVLSTSASPLYTSIGKTINNPILRNAAKTGVFIPEFAAENAMFVYGGAALTGNLSEVKAEDFMESVAMLGVLKVKGMAEKTVYQTAANVKGEQWKNLVKKIEFSDGEYDALRSQGYLKPGAEFNMTGIRKLEGYALQDLMSNPRVPESAKRKILFAGKGIAIQTDMPVSEVAVRQENNQFYVDVKDRNGNLLETEWVKDGKVATKKAKVYEDQVIRNNYIARFEALNIQQKRKHWQFRENK